MGFNTDGVQIEGGRNEFPELKVLSKEEAFGLLMVINYWKCEAFGVYTASQSPKDAVTFGLMLAMTAPTEEHAEDTASIVDSVITSSGMTEREYDECVDDAKKRLNRTSAHAP